MVKSSKNSPTNRLGERDDGSNMPLHECEPPQIIGAWKKSSRSDQLLNVSCVRQAPTTQGAAFGDTKMDIDGVPGGPVIFVRAGATMAFLNALASGWQLSDGINA